MGLRSSLIWSQYLIGLIRPLLIQGLCSLNLLQNILDTVALEITNSTFWQHTSTYFFLVHEAITVLVTILAELLLLVLHPLRLQVSVWSRVHVPCKCTHSLVQIFAKHTNVYFTDIYRLSLLFYKLWFVSNKGTVKANLSVVIMFYFKACIFYFEYTLETLAFSL